MKFPKSMVLALVAMVMVGCTHSNLSEKTVAENKSVGIQWVKNTDGVTFDEVKGLARAQGKAIFMDFYTKWCGPCKAMDRDVFPTKPIGDYYNAKFINFKVDAEVGEGVTLAETYDVQGYPTFVYTDAEGDVLREGSSIGFGDVDGMIELAKLSLGEAEEKPLSWYEAEYENGNRGLQFLNDFVSSRLREKRMPASMQLKEDIFLATPEAQRFLKDSDAYNYVLWDASPGNMFYDQLLANQDKYPQLFGDRVAKIRFVQQKIMMSAYARDGAADQGQVKAKLAEDFADVYALGEGIHKIDSLRFGGGATDEYVKSYVAFMEKNDLPMGYDDFSFPSAVVSMKNLEPKYAKLALPSFETNVKKDPSHFYSVSNYCYLLYKSGEQDKAFAKAKEFSKLTAKYEGSKKTAKSYAVMKALEAKQDPTGVMQAE